MGKVRNRRNNYYTLIRTVGLCNMAHLFAKWFDCPPDQSDILCCEMQNCSMCWHRWLHCKVVPELAEDGSQIYGVFSSEEWSELSGEVVE